MTTPIKTKPMGVTVIVSGIVAMVTYTMPNKMRLILAALAGIAGGFANEVITK